MCSATRPKTHAPKKQEQQNQIVKCNFEHITTERQYLSKNTMRTCQKHQGTIKAKHLKTKINIFASVYNKSYRDVWR